MHPKYLDQKGLTACWRETLLAKHVLEGKTKGYKNHPQLTRFKNSPDPLASINYYLSIIQQEATSRNYNYDISKIDFSTFENNKIIPVIHNSIPLNNKQLEYEWQHLLKKLETRDQKKYQELKNLKPSNITPHPIFKIVKGEVEGWEIKK